MFDPISLRPALADLPDEPTFRRDLRRVALGPIIILGVTVLTLLGLIRFLLLSAREVERLDTRMENVVAVEKLAVDMETSVRGFEIAGDERFLEPWKAAQRPLAEDVSALRASADSKLDDTKELRKALEQWTGWAESAIQARRSGQLPADPSLQLAGKQMMDEVRASAFRLIKSITETRARRAEILHLLETAVVVGVAAGGILFVLGTFLVLRRLMRKVREAYHRSLSSATRQIEELNVLLRSIGDAVLVTNAEGRILFLNRIAENLTGWSSNEARGRPLDEVFVIFNEETHQLTENPAQRVLREGIVVGLANHTVLRSRDGREWPIEDSAAPIVAARGETLGVILVFHDVSERRAQERRVLLSEQRYRNVFNLQFQFMAILSPEGRIVEINDLPLRVGKIERDQVVGKLLWETPWWNNLPEMQRLLAERLAAAAQSDTPILSEDEYRDGNHAVRTADAAITSVKDESGHVQFFIVQASDSTERKLGEQALREAERRFRFLNELGDAIRHLSDPSQILQNITRLIGRHLVVSRCAYADVDADAEHFTILHDYTDGCATTVGHYQLSSFGPLATEKMRSGQVLVINDVDRELLPDEGAAMFHANGIKSLIFCPLTKEGQLRAIMAVHQTTPRHWSPAEIALVEEVVERSWAYVERVRSEAALRASEERVRLALEAASMGAWEIELPSGRRRWDVRSKSFFALTPDAEVGEKEVAAGLHPDDRDRIRETFQRIVHATGPLHIDLEMRTVASSAGELRWLRAIGQASLDDSGKPTRVIGTLQDITALKENEARLRTAKDEAENASRAKDNFLAALSHELRTPLTPVLLTTAALRRRPQLPSEVYADLATIQRNVELEARLIDDLLDQTRIARGKLTLREQPCDVHSLIGLAIDIVRDEAQAKRQELNLELSASRSWLTADPARLQQLFWNLFRNAVKFTPAGGRISVRTEDAGDSLRVQVSDTGVGLDAGALERIFQPFEQLGYENDHRFGGLGLGLAIARAIVELHDGKILAESAGPNLGATFTVEFPSVRHAPPETPSVAPDGSQPTSSRPRPSLRLLVVEDNEPTLAVLARLLRRDGHEVVTAATVREALAAAAQHTFDGTVSDLGLPDGTGIELMEELRTRYGLRGIALSGYGMEEDAQRTLKAGFLKHLVKPIDFDTLRRALDAFAGQPPDDAQSSVTPQSAS